jgi:hypothetical protein
MPAACVVKLLLLALLALHALHAHITYLILAAQGLAPPAKAKAWSGYHARAGNPPLVGSLLLGPPVQVPYTCLKGYPNTG